MSKSDFFALKKTNVKNHLHNKTLNIASYKSYHTQSSINSDGSLRDFIGNPAP